MERTEVRPLHAIGSITLPADRVSIMEGPDKVAAFINMARGRFPSGSDIESVRPSGPVHRFLARPDRLFT
jgi:hypothetical protein